MKKHRIEITDDLNGKPAAETITFGLDQSLYVIDLDKRNAAKLRTTLSRYMLAGRSEASKLVGCAPEHRIDGPQPHANGRLWLHP